MGKKTKDKKEPTFPQSVAIRWDDSGGYSDNDSSIPLMLAETTAEEHGNLSRPVTVGVYELQKIVRVEARSVVTIITHDAKGK